MLDACTLPRRFDPLEYLAGLRREAFTHFVLSSGSYTPEEFEAEVWPRVCAADLQHHTRQTVAALRYDCFLSPVSLN